jgi:membrane associated rhomboid family serine protease
MIPAMADVVRRDRDPRRTGLELVGAMIALMWASEIVDTIADHRLDRYGIEPRDADGLLGILTAPFLHVGFDHLISNTIPFAFMGAAIALSGAARVLLVTAIVAFVSGLGTWLIAPSGTVHLGASGVVFGFGTYLISRGVFDRSITSLLVGALVGAVWGTALLGGLLPEDGISWQAHLFGAVGGVIAARLLSTTRAGTRVSEA